MTDFGEIEICGNKNEAFQWAFQRKGFIYWIHLANEFPGAFFGTMLKRLASQTATYGLTSILGRLIGNLLLPLQTARLSLHDFSVLSEILAYAAVLAVLFPLGLETALFKFSNDDPEKKSIIETRIIGIQLLFSILILPLSFFWLSSRLGGMSGIDLWLICGTLALDSITGIFLARLRNHGKSGKFLFIRLGSIGLTILLNVLFLSKIEFFDSINFIGINYRLIVYINFLASAITLLFLAKSLLAFRFQFDLQLAIRVLKFSVPMLLMSILGVANDIFGRIWLENLTPAGFYNNLSNANLIGIYSGCAKVAIFINLGIQAYRYAADPFFFSIQDKNDTANYLAKSFTWFSAMGLLALVAIQCNLDLIVQLFLRKPEFQLGLSAIFFLLLANFFFGVYYNLSFWYKFSEKTFWGTLISVSGLLINAGLNFVLVPRMGMTGSAVALLVCYLFMCVISWIKSRSVFSVKWEYAKFALLLFGALALCGIRLIWQPDGNIVKVAWGAVHILAFILLIIWVQKEYIFKRFSLAGPR